MTSSDKKFKKQNGTLKEQVKLAKNNDLKIYAIHAKYNDELIDNFWNTLSFKYVKLLYKDINLCKKYNILILVIHLDNKNFKTFTIEGLKKINSLIKYAKSKNVILAIENTYNNNDFIDDLFKIYNDNNLKFCYDSGHDFVFNKKPYEILKNNLDNLICLHLHDNNGNSDEHLFVGEGKIDWQIIKGLLKKRKNIPLCLEILNKKAVKDISYKEAIKKAKESLEKHLI